MKAADKKAAIRTFNWLMLTNRDFYIKWRVPFYDLNNRELTKEERKAEYEYNFNQWYKQQRGKGE